MPTTGRIHLRKARQPALIFRFQQSGGPYIYSATLRGFTPPLTVATVAQRDPSIHL